MSDISQDTVQRLDNEQIQVVLRALAKLTSRSPEELKPYVDELLVRLGVQKVTNQELASDSFYETATHEQWSAEFHRWIDSHKGEDIPVLSDQAMSRESIYPDRW